MRKDNRQMLEGPILKNVIRYTIPIILTSWLQLLFNAADLVVVGQFDGSNSEGYQEEGYPNIVEHHFLVDFSLWGKVSIFLFMRAAFAELRLRIF